MYVHFKCLRVWIRGQLLAGVLKVSAANDVWATRRGAYSDLI